MPTETQNKIIGKGDLVDIVAQKTGATKKAASGALNAILEVIEEQLKNGNSVRLIPFGSFEVRDRMGRVGFNPRTKEKIDIPARKIPAFKPGKALKDAVK